ncbi:5-oxoprolinase subunit B family protein [Marinobacterium sedimentorum]|uniref:5-oxoprolinase subunit B family protein n=1 Tax=Marinobacterium sedimentorum TaxID=2927804 RepID=UPI0020C65AFB|nr:allophanate hydrolase subunit 1 [Marinobacterium sedimentorum]MCP8687216.1 allophanate hydrolase subunit 1 [Marinobacterium sedimentorum]
MRIEPVGESGCMLYLGEQIEPAVCARVCCAAELIRRRLAPYITDLVPSYASIFISLDLSRGGVMAFCALLRDALHDLDSVASESLVSGDVMSVGVYYGPEVAPDMDEVMQLAGLSSEEVIALHCGQEYLVYAIGFSPGFCFMGNTDARLKVPRKASPRTRVPAGSVALADRQTAVYPCVSPGGWQIIGRTAVDMLALCQRSESPLQVGSRLRFEPVSLECFVQAGGRV